MTMGQQLHPSGVGGFRPGPSQMEEETSILKQMKPHVPGIVIFADHNRPLPWTVQYHSVVVFVDVSGFTALCENYSTTGQSGVDQLTRTLNEYLSALVEIILGSDGDILKFAGDAILAIWRVGRVEELQNEIQKVLGCCLDIQHTCGQWDTDIGVKLTVKLGVSAGEMSVTFLGNQEYRHYVELGPAVTAVNVAEHFCQSGMIVVSPETLNYFNPNMFETEMLEDQRHFRIVSILPRRRSYSLPLPSLVDVHINQARRMSTLSDDIPIDLLGKVKPNKQPEKPTTARKTPISDTPCTVKEESKTPEPPAAAEEGPQTSEPNKGPNVPIIKVSDDEDADTAPKKTFKALGKSKLGSKFGKLRKVVETVTEMRLDIALRLYILPPVLKKFDDNQPLEYLSEMRQVVIVFLNLELDQIEDSEKSLQKIFEIVYSKSKAMHGCLNKVFLFDKGCTFLVIFGLPGYKHENDCAHALICAGRMKSQLDKIDGLKRVSIGITTGTTFCGVVGHPKRHEYSVIGRKVNMAARLMMHYPDKITCDTDTFQKCRLPPAYFVVLITKRMKGLRNVGVIREFAGMTKDEKMVAKGITHSAYPMLGRNAEEFVFREQIGAMTSNEKQRRHIMFSGPSGLGKTKLLDQLITVSNLRSFKVISCRVELEDSSYPYFVANHILRALLSNNGFSDHIEKEPYILDAIGEEDVKYLYLLNDVLGIELEKPITIAGTNINEKSVRRRILFKIARMCVVGETETVVIIDDAHNIDTSSWEFLLELLPIKQALIVLGIRPSIIDMPPCREAMLFIDHPEMKLVDLGTLDLKYMAPLACQMMNVISLPSDLDRLLRERSHGVPAWCREILKDMLDKGQLLVVKDDGRPAFRQSRVAPKKSLVKPLSSIESLVGGSGMESISSPALNITITEIAEDQVGVEDEAQKSLLSDLGFIHTQFTHSYKDLKATPRQMSTGGAMVIDSHLAPPKVSFKPDLDMDKALTTIKTSRSDNAERIAMFAKGIQARDIPVPPSMKELIIGRIDSMRASDQLMIKCAAVLGKKVRRDILEMLLPKAHRAKLVLTIRRLIESGIFQCGNTPSSKLFKKASKEDAGHIKYLCYCHKDDVVSKPGDIEACFEPMFTNNLLQQTAYDVLMESQRIELHAKAAHYFELSADELRANIPYYVLCRSPEENLQEMLQCLEYDDMFVPQRIKRGRNKVTDEIYARQAANARAMRGRRKAVSITEEEAIPLVHRILERAKPLESPQFRVECLLPLYDNICHHWSKANQPWHVLVTMVEAAVAALFVKKNSKALELILRVQETLEQFPVPSPEREVEYRAIRAKVQRLHGKVMFESGDITEAYTCLFKALSILGVEQRGKRVQSSLSSIQTMAKFWWNWRFGFRKHRPTSILTMEHGYCLIDLHNMEKEMGNAREKCLYALQHFNKVIGQRVHLHQVIEAYSGLIECCREKNWIDTAHRLEAELLTGCAARSDELSTEDRSLVANIYAERCKHLFLTGQIEQANVAGKTSTEICICLHDMETTKLLAPYFFYVCLVRGQYEDSQELLMQLKFSSQITDDRKSRAMYYTLCLEIATAGGFPPDSVGTCILFITKYLQSCDASVWDFIPRYYAAMTTAVWCARMGKWSQTQVWFDYWEIYETDDVSFFSVMARAKKLECMLLSLSKCLEIGNIKVAKQLKTNIRKDLKYLLRTSKEVPTLEQRCVHLDCYFKMLTGSAFKAKLAFKSVMESFKHVENRFEESWIKRNFETWMAKRTSNTENVKYPTKEQTRRIHWEIEGKNEIVGTTYTLPLPVRRKKHK